MRGLSARLRPRISFCMLPPESRRIGLSGPPPRTSKRVTTCSAKARPAARPRGRRREARLAHALQHGVFQIAIRRPRRRRCDPPHAADPGGDESSTGSPDRATAVEFEPAGTRRLEARKRGGPASTPLPETPMMPSVSPACTAKSMPCRAAADIDADTRQARRDQGGWLSRCGRATRRPTMSSASSSLVGAPCLRPSTTTRPPRSTR